jgi:hypothetical protein
VYLISLDRIIVGRRIRMAKLSFKIAPHGLGPPISARDPCGGPRVDTAIERLVAFAQLPPFEPRGGRTALLGIRLNRLIPIPPNKPLKWRTTFRLKDKLHS